MTAAPPPDNGVGPSQVQVPAGQWPSLFAFLCERFPAIPADTWTSRFARQRILDAAGQPLAADAPCRCGDRITYFREVAAEPAIPFAETILYQDEHVLVADKPHFLPVIPSGRFVQQTLLARLKKSTGITTLSPIHRIDRDTAGLVLFSVNPQTRDAYQALFRERQVQKTYEAIAPPLTGRTLPLCYRSRLVTAETFFRTAEVPGEPNSETRVEWLAQSGEQVRYRLVPVTGRKHQLRVHMAALGAPIENDRWYPVAQPQGEDDYSRPLQLLARHLAFTDPLDGQPRAFTSARQLSGWRGGV